MSKAFKSALIIGGVLVVLIVVVVVGLEQLSHRLRDNPEATLTFATSAKTLHDKLDPDALDNMVALADRIAGAASDNISEIRNAILRGQLANVTYRETFTYIRPTMDALDLYNNLQREASSIGICYAKLASALTEFEGGHPDLVEARLAEARASHDRAVTLRQQNTAALDDLIAATRARLGD